MLVNFDLSLIKNECILMICFSLSSKSCIKIFCNNLKLGNMLMTPKEESAEHKQVDNRKDFVEDQENEANGIFTQDPMDWVLKNENVLEMISVRFELLCW